MDPAPLDADIATPWRTLVDWFLGRWETGRADCAVVGEMFPATPSAHMAWALSMAGLFATVTGGSGEASLGQASRTYGDRNLYFFTALHHWAAGTVRWLRADLDAAATHLHRSARWLADTGAIGFEGLLLAELPEVLVQLGDAAGARRAAERATEIDQRLRTSFSAAQAAYTQALVAPRGPVAAAAFEAAARGYAAVSAPFLRARALEHQAEVVPGRRLDLLGEAARLYTALPAPRHAERVLAALRAAGPAGQRAAQHAGALTAREAEIAALAARGLPTADIAARLHLSTRTVETHLGRVYRKLGIDRRSRLADALGG